MYGMVNIIKSLAHFFINFNADIHGFFKNIIECVCVF